MIRCTRLNLIRLYNSSGNVQCTVSRKFCSDSGDEKKMSNKATKKVDKKADKKSSASLNRLNDLLSMMSTNSEVQLIKPVQIAKPQSQRKEKDRQSKKKLAKQEDSVSDDDKSADLAKATRKVAISLAGDVNQTEAELLAKLLEGTKTGGDSLSDIITGMQVDKGDTKQSEVIKLTKSSTVRQSIERKATKDLYGKPRERKRPTEMVQRIGVSVKLFEEEPLNIFNDPTALKDCPDILKMWNKLQDRELRLAVTHPPANHFQKLARFTEQGKLWKFPIDNEQGLETEAKVYFTDHIFLEDHLEGWCPERGPIRHFMELVCVGLSKNYFISAQEKKEHILWFRDYFDLKKDMLNQVMLQQQTEADKKFEK
ncbi:small ribosomal subunit protein mS31 [Malaya genurostris]|uniref:small ribosomal subunit protein mS31 n=1 Tax=Malaya genurostris TaxID=325434 RepID=UPI0026F3EFE4|nr:small ribosomal subunit protein mS31 [Malaya genurostris]